jgi:hypothetical protein
MSEDKNTIPWDIKNDDEADFIRKTLSLLHIRYEDKPPDFIIIAAFLMQKRLEEIDGPQINEYWKNIGGLN